ncbi:phosphoserine phosphatase SerB [Aestuariivirga litoralis]|uniref:phosphoserine phosphatase SerB n=1 Tax=Aestuariivirga litoralis TaxID=2650924 RepID=UPI0018C7BCC4|nr:phosphoserine phosphatase SerB [Aestuariivirga litoralis]
MDSVLVLIAAPGSGAITAGLAEELGAVRWLAHGDALEADAAFEAEARELCAGLPIDINVVPEAKRRKRILLADMDSTMIEQECIDELGVVAGVGDRIKDITARSMRGDLDFEGALKERVGLLRGLDEGVIATLIRERISFMAGGATLLATMKAHGAYCALVSGGFTAFTAHVAGTLGFHEHRANTLLIEAGKLKGEVAMPILGKDAKVEAMNRITKAQGTSAADVIAVGDGANDIPMLQAAGIGVALHAKPKVQEQAQYVINHGDLTALLYLQGYAQSEHQNLP